METMGEEKIGLESLTHEFDIRYHFVIHISSFPSLFLLLSSASVTFHIRIVGNDVEETKKSHNYICSV